MNEFDIEKKCSEIILIKFICGQWVHSTSSSYGLGI